MNSVLPLVVKAQRVSPYDKVIEGQIGDYDEAGLFYFKSDIERERLGWEQREKALKQKIKKAAEKLRKLDESGDASFRDWEKLYEELLGLSK